MANLKRIERYIRFLRILLELNLERYHAVTLCGNWTKRHRIHRQCYDLRRSLDRLEDMRRQLGGEPQCQKG